MSLKAFHAFFIVASFVLAAYFGGWCVSQYNDTQNAGMLAMAVASFATSTGLALYLIWVLKKLKAFSFLALSLFLLGHSQTASACAVCIGNANSPLTRAVNDGVWFLLIVVGVVLVAFASLFLFWRHRSKQFGF